jgi:AcrR family transcriptional regulator
VPPRLPAARRRRQLLVAATELFGTRGYRHTSMEDIAEAAGVTKPVLYQHFPSKQKLYVELLQAVGGELVTAVSAAATEPTPRRRVQAGLAAYFRFVSEQTSAFQLLFGTRAAGNDEFAEVIYRWEDELAAVMSGLLDVAHAVHERPMVASAVVGAAEITARDWIASARQAQPAAGQLPRLDPNDGDAVARQLADLLWGGLCQLHPA